ncbi:fluoride efflux transporter CrcB [Leptolyngbya sp. Cla-17]|uniref:fluoride efflux transporter CrcB n=1 Tax=Leptolyngbya sp. Cla-17 TaxID=2803751 RepID=UPI0018D7437A|nr:fluoride efflux transporter CrcB [Leptolyngbya sp. Cla-17]
MHSLLALVAQHFTQILTTADPIIRSPIAITLGAIPGALCRYYISLYFGQWFGTSFPFGTFFINLTGAFLMGVFVTFTLERSITSSDLRLLVAVGFLGSYTTFSTYALDTITLIQSGNFGFALFYWFSSALLGVLSVALGLLVTQKLLN